MIKIIKTGTKEVRTCDNCGCKFSFDAEDVITASLAMGKRKYVTCPQCKSEILLMSTKGEIR